jgi:membrane fusion protein (multidrug efflux system)
VVDREGAVEHRPVIVGEWHGDDWFIDGGLRAGERIVVDGGLTLRPDVKAAAQPYDPGAGSKPASASPPPGAAKGDAAGKGR